MDSKLQIISGAYRGRKLNLPVGARPTQNRARIALFNMMTSVGILPYHVWDAFAGSGAFGIECLSRFPNANVTFTDVAPTSVTVIRKNLSQLNVAARATVIQCDAVQRISQLGTASDLIFVDPPYAEHQVGNAFVKKLSNIARSGTILIWEQETINQYTPDETVWEILRDKTYGRARFLVLQKRSDLA